MGEIVEKVARALCRQEMLDDGYGELAAYQASAGDMHRNFLKAARAAIEAFEPTEDMSKAGADSLDLEISAHAAEMVFNAMKAEALK